MEVVVFGFVGGDGFFGFAGDAGFVGAGRDVAVGGAAPVAVQGAVEDRGGESARARGAAGPARPGARAGRSTRR